MIDWHSHILPGMDDGSHDTAESVSMLNMQAAQGVRTVIATPHFYANDESIDSFLARREQAMTQLKAELPEQAPAIYLGAEVKYYPGISRLENLKALRIEGSRLLLLEMPMSTWTESMIRELLQMSAKSSIRIVLAHVDRYMRLQKPDVWLRLLENGILMQANASYFTSLLTKQKAMRWLKNGSIRLVGSDCHNMTDRSPQIGKAFALIEKKLGAEFLHQINEYGYSLME